jgi:capsular exopolysaccharide synthesis family protein
VKNQIESVKARIQESIRNGLESNQLSYKQIDDQLEELRNQVSELPKNERDLLTIQRRFNLNNELYTFLLKKKSETEIARAGNKPKVRVLDKARDIQAALIGPKSKRIYIQANALGFLAVFGLLGVSFFLQNKITEVEQIKEKGNTTVIGRIPHIRSKRNKMSSALISSKDPFSEAFRGVKLNLDFIVSKKDSAKVIGVTSAESGEGKTFSALNVASVCAVSGKKTLLMGLDLRKPRLQDELNLSDAIGLSNFLVQNASIEEIIQKSELEGLDVIVSGPVPPNPAELLGSEHFAVLMKELSQKYDYIICDGAPIGLVTDYLSAVPFVDTTLFVIRLKYSKLNATNLLTDFVSKGLVKSAHILINDVGERASKKYGYGYGYGYGENMKNKGFFAKIFKR